MKYFNVEHDGHVQVWTINNPPMNYLTAPMTRELSELVGSVENDESSRAIIIVGGVPGKFITHYSTDELASASGNAAAAARSFPTMAAGFHNLLNRLMLMPKAVIAAINGDCMGGGFEVALACDMRVAADGPYRIGLPESNIGILPGGGGTQRLPRLIGRGRALEAMLFGNIYSPQEAERLGMVNRVVAPDRLMSFVKDWAHTLSQRPPLTIGAIKRAVHLGADRDLEIGLYIERQEMATLMGSEEARAAMEAYNKTRTFQPVERVRSPQSEVPIEDHPAKRKHSKTASRRGR
jgi:enoyl-CoA hydratase